MTTPSDGFHFVNAPVAHRSARISQEKWEEHRAEATEIYLASNVGEVALQMRLRHGFHATERQYIYQFKKWGIKKQRLGPATTASTGASASATAAPWTPSPPSEDASPSFGLGTLKRRRVTTSVDRNSICSTESSSLKPVKKNIKQEHDYEHHSPSPKAPSSGPSPDTQHSYDKPSTPLSTSSTTHDAAVYHSPQYSPPDRDSAGGVPPTTPAPSSTEPANRPLPPLPWEREQPPAQDSPVDMAVASHDMATVVEDPIHEETSSARRRLRQIDRNRPVDTFSGQEMADIRRAADCFAVLHCEEEAFELYITLLKYRHSDPEKYIDPGFWYLLIQCASTASHPKHVEVIRNILRAKLGGSSSKRKKGVSMQKFLLHMLLALVACRNDDNPEGVGTDLVNAGAHAPNEDFELYERLPPDHRSLDLPLFANIMRFRTGELCSLTSPAVYGVSLHSGRMDQLEEYVLRRVLRLDDAKTRDGPSVIRSCLAWCKEKLQTFTSLKGPLTMPGAPGQPCMEMPWNEQDALFIRLWQFWDPRVDWDTPLWISESHAETGVSPTEMLMVISRMIHESHDHWGGPVNSDDDLLQSFREGTDYMLAESDMELGKLFLKQYITRNTVSLWPDRRQDTQRLDRVGMIKYVEETLGVEFPGIGIPPADLPCQAPPPPLPQQPRSTRTSLADQQNKHYSPTLASSLSSVDMSDFRKTGQSAALRLSRFARASGSISSFLSKRRSSNNRLSVGGVSDLSGSMGSMSISGESLEKRRLSSQHSTHVVRPSSTSVRRSEAVEPAVQEAAETEDTDKRSIATWV